MTENKKKEFLTIVGNMIIIKGVYDHDLTTIRVFFPRATFLSKKIFTIRKVYFWFFTAFVYIYKYF